MALAWMAGRWTFQRTVFQKSANTVLGAIAFDEHTQIVGTADVNGLARNDLHYRERGHHPSGIPFSKAYRFCLEADGNGLVDVYHADEAAVSSRFHRLAFTQTTAPKQTKAVVAEAEHLCAADSYVSIYEVSVDRMFIRHTVSGPRKDYRIETIYERATGTSA